MKDGQMERKRKQKKAPPQVIHSKCGKDEDYCIGINMFVFIFIQKKQGSETVTQGQKS